MHRKPSSKTKWERISFIKEGYEPLSTRLKHIDISFTDKESHKDAIARAAQEALFKATPVHVDHAAQEVFADNYLGGLIKVARYSTAPVMPPATAAEADLFAEDEELAA